MSTPPICDFGWKPSEFALSGVDGETHSLSGIKGTNGTLVMFICNHCPYVKAITTRLVEDIKILQVLDIGVIAVMSNDAVNYPADSFENMKVFSRECDFPFPYVIDETQEVARAFDAVCTPDFFGFNAQLELQYRGRLDEGTTNQPPPDARRDLLEGMKQIAQTGQGPANQTASMGCSIKWRD
jgi:peroxiredoxin